MSQNNLYEKDKFNFFAAFTHASPARLRTIHQYIQNANCDVDVLGQILVSPIFMSDSQIQIIREFSEQKSCVFFDSGGFSVQTGKITYSDLYQQLVDTYKRNRWASIYTLPDHPSGSNDSQAVLQRNMQETLEGSKSFYHQMPEELQSRALGVVHGKTFDQIDKYIDLYSSLGLKHLGFGGFANGGKNNEVNIFTRESHQFLTYICNLAHQQNMTVHAFGIGSPALIFPLKESGVQSFDSTSWIKVAGLGYIFMPFSRRFAVGTKKESPIYVESISQEFFQQLQVHTQHSCIFCNAFEELQSNWMYRAVHNLIVLKQSSERINNENNEQIQKIYQQGSQKYKRIYKELTRDVLQPKLFD